VFDDTDITTVWYIHIGQNVITCTIIHHPIFFYECTGYIIGSRKVTNDVDEKNYKTPGLHTAMYLSLYTLYFVEYLNFQTFIDFPFPLFLGIDSDLFLPNK